MQRLRDWFPPAAWMCVGLLMVFLMTHQPASAWDGSTWTIPYTGSVSTTGIAFSVYNNSTGSSSVGITGGSDYIGVVGQGNGGTSNPNGTIGVYGADETSSGNGFGVYGSVSGASKVGVYGVNNIANGDAVEVR